jgi:hypothetical protein
MSQAKKRSVGVTVFGVLFIVFNIVGLISLLVAPAMLQAVVDAGGATPELQAQADATREQLESGMGAAVTLGIMGFGAGVGLLLLQRWARALTLSLAGISILWTIINMFRAGPLPPGQEWVVILGLLPTFAWNGVVIWYFLRPNVKAQFAAIAAPTGQQAHVPTG